MSIIEDHILPAWIGSKWKKLTLCQLFSLYCQLIKEGPFIVQWSVLYRCWCSVWPRNNSMERASPNVEAFQEQQWQHKQKALQSRNHILGFKEFWYWHLFWNWSFYLNYWFCKTWSYSFQSSHFIEMNLLATYVRIALITARPGIKHL